MSSRSALARWLPTDDGYAPFGLRWLEGMNALPVLLVALVSSSWVFAHFSLNLALREVGAVEWVLGLAMLLFYMLLHMPMVAAVVAVANLGPGWGFASRMAWMAAAVLGGAAFLPLAKPLEQALAHALYGAFGPAVPAPGRFVPTAAWYLAVVLRGAMWGALLAAVVLARRRQHRAVRAERELRMRQLGAERQEAEMRLRALQAQVEPHFLFNTLAHVQRLQQVDPDRGRAMLRHLGEVVRSALPRMRGRDSTLADELALVRAYVGVQQVRMGERLRTEIDVAAELLRVRVPPMMVLVLAENAVKHGIGPRRDGGALRIAARRRPDDRLEIEVLDDGVGLRPAAGGGQGLANTRARLATLFGGAGVLEIGNRAQGGVRAALLLPFVHAPTGAAA